jgi:hypothetical protein
VAARSVAPVPHASYLTKLGNAIEIVRENDQVLERFLEMIGNQCNGLIHRLLLIIKIKLSAIW